MNERELREEIVRLGPWHQDLEVAPGVRTGEPAPPDPGQPKMGVASLIEPDRAVGWLARELFPDGFAGRSVLDCACNAAGYLFAAKRLGAGRCFGFDVREHWIRQARFLAEHLPSEDVEFDTFDLYQLPGRGLGQFDVTLFNGIFYHLPDPVTGLRIAADHTKELLVVNTSVLPGDFDGLVLSREGTAEVMSGVHGLAWLPSGEGVLRAILEWCGFPHARLRFEGETVVKGRRRIELVAARAPGALAHFDEWRARHQPARGRGWVRRLLRRG